MTKARVSKLKRVVGWGVTGLTTALAVLITVTVGWRPVLGARSRALTDRHFEPTPERLEHGKYLVEGVLGCLDCHSQLNGEPKPGEAPVFTARGGGRVMVNQGGFVLAASNISPDTETGAGTWTDDQFARAIREGIGHDGRTLFPIMPYPNFRNLSDEDLASVVVYIRSLEPVHSALPKPQIATRRTTRCIGRSRAWNSRVGKRSKAIRLVVRISRPIRAGFPITMRRCSCAC